MLCENRGERGGQYQGTSISSKPMLKAGPDSQFDHLAQGYVPSVSETGISKLLWTTCSSA